MIASKKALAVRLSKLKTYENPDARLEQYPTDSEVAAAVLWKAYMDGNIEGRTVADLGAGTGILGIGALLLGASHVTFVEKDVGAVAILRENLAAAEGEHDIQEGDILGFHDTVHTIVQNPPFGTRNEGADVRFLQHAMTLAPAIYSLHKTATQQYLEHIASEAGYHVKDILAFDFPLKRTRQHHRRKIHRIEVSCLCLERQE